VYSLYKVVKKEKRVGLLGKGKRTANSIGEISEAAIIARFLQLGYVVLNRMVGTSAMTSSSKTMMESSGASSVNLPGLMKVER
jgi:hypothetical protein